MSEATKQTTRHQTIELSENALAVLKKRYLKKNEAGEAIEEPIDMFRRVASNIAEGEYRFKEGEEAEALYEDSKEKFLQMMLSRKFMPNSPTLMNAGREMQQLSACFVLPVEDSIDGIYDTLKHQAIIHKSGGGTGFGFSRLRPKNDLVKSTMGVSSGPVSFMAIYDASTDKIKQGGTRRGANMGILRVDHPDIEDFITCKKDNDQINNFNISVAITDEFMEAVDNDADFDLKNPRDGEVIKTIRARELFRQIVEGAWLNGEPGVVFIDRINGDNPTPQFPIESTNPCSEAHLPPYDSCNLGSINVERFVLSPEEAEAKIRANGFAKGLTNGNGTSGLREAHTNPCVDWNALKQTVYNAIRFLDNVIEANNYPLQEIEKMSRGNRRIGLGVMGFADALIKLGVPYDSEVGLDLARSIMGWIDLHAWEASRELAKERGVMPHYEGSSHQERGDEVRNATVTTIAPTGTISMIAGCSGGIEPLFAVAFMRRQADMKMPDVNPEFVKLSKERGFYSEEMMEKVARHGSIRDPRLFPEVPEDVRGVFATSGDISPEWHVRMQAAFQAHTSMGISKTINLPNEATVEEVKDAYEFAFEQGCKGIAVYRDGSRDAQVLSTGKTDSAEKPVERPEAGDQGEPSASPPPQTLAEARNGRPDTLSGVTKKLKTGHGPMYVSMNDDEYGPRECFIVLGKPGGTAAAFSDALGRMISLAMTHGASPAEVVNQLRGIQDGHPMGFGPDAVLSVPDGVAKAMAEHYLGAEEGGPVVGQATLPITTPCPDCGGELRRESGCDVCTTGGCGYSRCS